jgi:hypothetical protein
MMVRKKAARKGIENGWDLKDVDPCFQYARLITAIECHLNSATRHINRGDATSANNDLVMANHDARKLSSILPATKRHAGEIAKGTDALVDKLKSGKAIPEKDRSTIISRISAMKPPVRDLFVKGSSACKI